MPIDMPRPRPPHLHREVTRHGRTVWYVRFGLGKRIRIRSAFGTAEFDAEYQAAINGVDFKVNKGPDARSLAWLIERHKDSSAWDALAPATQRQRINLFKTLLDSADKIPYAQVTKTDVIAAREHRKHTPSQANNFLDALRGLFNWAIESGLVAANPCDGVKNVKRPRNGGFRAATEDEIAAFEARWPVGTRQRLALTIFLETGLRRGDAAALGRQHIRNGIIRIQTQKTKQIVSIPISDTLASAIKATPNSHLAFIAQESGAPMTKESLGNWFHQACVAAGVRFSAHGLRKAATARLANLGLTNAEIEQIMGWSAGSGMMAIYSRSRNADILADNAAKKMGVSKAPISSP